MAYKIIRWETDRYQVREEITAVLDAADLDALGITWSSGSIAMIANKGVLSYMLNASGEWKEV